MRAPTRDDDSRTGRRRNAVAVAWRGDNNRGENATRSPEVRRQKIRKLGEKITIHHEASRCRVMCARARPPPFARMNARDARAGRKKSRPSGTPRGLITIMTVEPAASPASNPAVISTILTATVNYGINYGRLQDARPILEALSEIVFSQPFAARNPRTDGRTDGRRSSIAPIRVRVRVADAAI